MGPKRAVAMPTLIPLANVDADMIETLLDRTFGADRFGRTAYAIREGTQWLENLSFAALDDDDMLVATIQCWPVALTTDDGRSVPMVMVGPVAVLPEHQGDGYGTALMLAMIDAERRMVGPDQASYPQVMIGDPEYYGRWGFNAAHTAHWRVPGPVEQHRLLMRTAVPDALPTHGMLGPWISAQRAGLAN